DYTFSNSALAMSKAFKEIRREGIGKLLLYACKQDALGIAMHYSMASVHGTQILSRQDVFTQNRQGWLDILEDMGYQYRFVSSRQIEADELNRYRVLILPYSIALGEREASKIRSFAQRGGLVIGDVQTGLMDEHCKLSAHGVLDDFFGIERLSADWEHFYLNNGFERNPNFPYAPQNLRYSAGQEEEHFGTTLAEAGTRVKGGVCAFVDGFMQSVPAVTVKEHGTGKGIYLNFALKDYPRHRAAAPGAALRSLLHDLLGLNGLQKPAMLQTRDGEPMEQGVESYYYAYGRDAHIVAVQWALNESAETNYDGLTKAAAGGQEEAAQDYDLVLPKEHHVYDVREKSYKGFTRRIQGRVAPGDHCIYALLPYRAERMTLTAQ
ncbi:MAG TPA: beta-galactosidase trimerization domain-containing protein, partial [Clostridia bacterium]|nr:beta-galactosidase trimerization domain-containing protein [Clostridia bacterium]